MKTTILIAAIATILVSCKKEEKKEYSCRYYKNGNNWVFLECGKFTDQDNAATMQNYSDGTTRKASDCSECNELMATLPQ